MSLDCPHCNTEKAYFIVLSVSAFVEDYLQHPCADVSGSCSVCQRQVIAKFLNPFGYDGKIIQEAAGSLTGRHVIRSNSSPLSFVGQFPERPTANAPMHLPGRVEAAFIEAEKAFNAGLWGLAVSGYGKAVERGITPFIEKVGDKDTLGMKLGKLKNSGVLPTPMIEWIDVVKDGRNLAMHGDDFDYESKEQANPSRLFARTLLKYLYTLPEEVKLAREKDESPDE